MGNGRNRDRAQYLNVDAFFTYLYEYLAEPLPEWDDETATGDGDDSDDAGLPLSDEWKFLDGLMNIVSRCFFLFGINTQATPQAPLDFRTPARGPLTLHSRAPARAHFNRRRPLLHLGPPCKMPWTPWGLGTAISPPGALQTR